MRHDRNFEVDILYSDDDELGNSDDIVVGTFDIGGLEPDDLLTQTVSVQLPVDVLNARAQADDVPNQGAGYISNSLDFLGIQLDPKNEIAEVNETNNVNTTKGRGIDDVTYFPWDIDNNGLVTPTDAIFTINRLGQSGPDVDAQADFDGNGLVSPTDAIAAINRVGYSINPEVTTPVIQAALSNDTGISHLDTITTDPTISGAIADATAVSQFKAGFNDTPTANFTDISGELLPDGRFDLSAERLGEIFGNVDLPLGSHTLHLVAEDAQGNEIATLDFVFTLTTPNPDLPPAPRLFLDAAELSETRSAITVEGSHHQQAFTAIKARVDQNDWRVYDENLSDGNWNYARAWLAREAAFVYLVTGEQAYAQSAFDALFAIYEDPDPDGRRPNSGNGLARAATGMGFALGYDWAASGWTQSQKDYVKGKILTALDAWPNYSYPNFASPYGSNWVAVSRGAELVMMLSVDEERNRASRFDNLKFWLKEHLEVAYGETGLTQEGQGYLSYAGGFLMPAVYALRSIGDTSLESAFTPINFEQLPLYAGVFDQAQSSLQFGVGWLGFDAEGFTSFLLDAASPETQPYYQYFYDRHRGINSPVPDAEKFDYRRAGTVWSVLYYPTDTPAIDPSGILPVAIQDREKGSYLFRNRWQDENDVLISLMGDFTHHRRSWDQPEAFALGLHAYDTHYFGGPTQGRDAEDYSRLIVDGKAGNRNLTGAAEFFEARNNGGYAIVDGGSLYNDLGIDEAKRHLLVDFSGDAGGALLSTMDRIEDLENHIYTWQANLGTVNDDGGIVATAGQEGDVKTFLLKGNNDSYLKGWILNPSDATVTAGDPLQIETEGSDTDIWVVMLVGAGAPPVANVTGTGLESRLRLGNALVYFDSALNRIVATS